MSRCRAVRRSAAAGAGVAASTVSIVFVPAFSPRAAGCVCSRCRRARTVRYRGAVRVGIAAFSAAARSLEEIWRTPGGSAVSADSSSTGRTVRGCRSPIAAVASGDVSGNGEAAGAASAANRRDRIPVGTRRLPVGATAGAAVSSGAAGTVFAGSANHLRARAAHQGKRNSSGQQEPRQN
jgi:hypothetical protein